MSSPDDIPKLRMAPPESAEDIARRIEHERQALHREREFGLEQSLAPFRVGSVEYLNAVPLTRGIEDQIVLATPARLAELLRRDELDAALVSITEVLLNDRYDILDGIAIASLGEVFSVLLAHKKPLEEAKEIFCDTASLTSVNLLKVLLAERGLKPEFKPLENYKAAAEKDFVLLIGDRAIDFQRCLPRTRTKFLTWARRGLRRRTCRLSMPCGRCGAGWRTRRCAGCCVRRRISGWRRSKSSSAIIRPTTSISARIISAGRSISISARTKNAASRNSANCSTSTASARCSSRSLFRSSRGDEARLQFFVIPFL